MLFLDILFNSLYIKNGLFFIIELLICRFDCDNGIYEYDCFINLVWILINILMMYSLIGIYSFWVFLVEIFLFSYFGTELDLVVVWWDFWAIRWWWFEIGTGISSVGSVSECVVVIGLVVFIINIKNIKNIKIYCIY